MARRTGEHPSQRETTLCTLHDAHVKPDAAMFRGLSTWCLALPGWCQLTLRHLLMSQQLGRQKIDNLRPLSSTSFSAFIVQLDCNSCCIRFQTAKAMGFSSATHPACRQPVHDVSFNCCTTISVAALQKNKIRLVDQCRSALRTLCLH